MASVSQAGPREGRSAAGPRVGGTHLRLSSVDHLRGLVMVVMVLDHTREFFTNPANVPENLATTHASLFLTRWVTHVCAPVFVFLAGTGAFLAGSRGKSRAHLATFLVTRGLWLMLLEVTVVKLGWFFHLDYSFVLLQVIWAIGGSMVVLAGLIFLPIPAIALLGLAIIAGHNVFDGPAAKWLEPLGKASVLIRPGGFEPFPRVHVVMAYPVVPWLGVMAVGYAFGPVLLWGHHRRRAVIFGLGLGLSLAFLALRALNVYGDPAPWSPQKTPTLTVLSFLNCQKYPPSLLYLLMTLGPALMLLAWFDGGAGAVGRRLVTFGRVPLFFYLLQWPLVHGMAVLAALARGEPVAWLFKDAPFGGAPAGYGYGLGTVYAMWAVAVVVLYVPCRWFAGLKRRRHDPWLSYL